MKTCKKCDKTLPTTNFYKGRYECKNCFSKRMKKYREENNYNKKYYEENKEKDRKRCLEYYYENKNDPEKKLKWRENQLKVKYNITLEVYNKMYEEQGYKCAICESDKPVGNGVLHVDHCHKTGNIRGLLCHSCNTSLGGFKDNVDVLKKAIEYLEKNNGLCKQSV